MKLNERLERIRAGAAKRVPEASLEVMHRSTQELVASGQAERAIGMGDRAPDFVLEDSLGHPVSLAALCRQGPVVVTFFRGHW